MPNKIMHQDSPSARVLLCCAELLKAKKEEDKRAMQVAKWNKVQYMINMSQLNEIELKFVRTQDLGTQDDNILVNLFFACKYQECRQNTPERSWKTQLRQRVQLRNMQA
jgi:hypothetical protein